MKVMKQLYIRPTSAKLTLAPSTMLAASLVQSGEHDTIEQYSNEKQFDADSEESAGWEWE